MKLKRKEDQSVDISILLRRGNKIPMDRVTEKMFRAEIKRRAIQRLPHLGFIPYTITKPRHYCVCQQVLAERGLIMLSPERLFQCLANTEVDAHSHPLDRAKGPQ